MVVPPGEVTLLELPCSSEGGINCQGNPIPYTTSIHLYLFVNRRRNRAKVLFFDGTGLCIFMKRLERGRFAALWERTDEQSLRLTTSELAVFLEGSKVVGKIPLILPDLGADCLNTRLAGSQKR